MKHQQPFQSSNTRLGMITQKLQRQDIDSLANIKRIVIADCFSDR
jgi:hypothetical protein